MVGDYFTKWIEAYAIPNQEAVTVARKLVDQMFCRFSPPEQLHSDQGKQFESEVMLEVCKLLGIKKTRTSPYHPQCDGLVERSNRTLLSMLATTTHGHPFDWEDQLPKVCMAYNTSIHASTGYTPFFLMFGCQARLPIDLVYGTKVQQIPVKEYATSTKQALEEAYGLVRQKLKVAHCFQKAYYDRKLHGKPFAVGDLVWLFSPAVPRGHSKKLHHPWTGLYRVIAKLSENDYRIKKLTGRKTVQVVHFDRLKPCDPTTRFDNPAVSPQKPVLLLLKLGLTILIWNCLILMMTMKLGTPLSQQIHLHPLPVILLVLVATPIGMEHTFDIEFEDKFLIDGELCRTDYYII